MNKIIILTVDSGAPGYDLCAKLIVEAAQAESVHNRVGGAVSPILSHPPVRTDMYTAVQPHERRDSHLSDML